MNRFLEWTDIGTLTFTPDDNNTVVGDVELLPDADTLWVQITSETAPTPWPWSYGILGWRSDNGYELGTCKAYSDQNGMIFRLGVGLVPRSRTGVLTFEPRSFNLAWVERGNDWRLQFSCRSGTTEGGDTRAAVNGFVDGDGDGLPLVRVDFT